MKASPFLIVQPVNVRFPPHYYSYYYIHTKHRLLTSSSCAEIEAALENFGMCFVTQCNVFHWEGLPTSSRLFCSFRNVANVIRWWRFHFKRKKGRGDYCMYTAVCRCYFLFGIAMKSISLFSLGLIFGRIKKTWNCSSW